MVCALLAGCTGPGAPSPAAASLTVQPKAGLRLNTGFVEFGDFTAFDEKLQWIDGCNEIPREVLEAAGMDLSRGVESEKSMSSWVCVRPAKDSVDRLASYGLMGSGANKTVISDKGLMIDSGASDVIPGLYTHMLGTTSQSDSCYASVDTVRGRFSIAYGDYDPKMSQSARCAKAVRAFEFVYQKIGGSYGSGTKQS